MFHYSLMKKDPGQEPWRLKDATPDPVLIDGEPHHEIAEILDSKVSRNVLYYLVKWPVFPESENEWVKAEHVKADNLIRCFHSRFPVEPRGKDLKGGGVNVIRIMSY